MDSKFFENSIYHSDNIEVMQRLVGEGFEFKAIVADPPYNTGQSFSHYIDKLTSVEWIDFMRPRVMLMRDLLSSDGTLWIIIDDNEAHYLKVLMDEIFERKNFLANIVWQRTTNVSKNASIKRAHDHILVYAKNRSLAVLKSPEVLRDLPPLVRDGDARGPWYATEFTAPGTNKGQIYPITTPSGATWLPQSGRCWAVIESRYKALLEDGRIYFGKDGSVKPKRKLFISECSDFLSLSTWWCSSKFGDNREATRHIRLMFPGEQDFSFSKPERLIKAILCSATNEQDRVLDPFGGSGTTAATAQKLGRSWVTIEKGDSARSVLLPRLLHVIKGADPGGITAAVKWRGGGSFTFHDGECVEHYSHDISASEACDYSQPGELTLF